MNKSGEEKQEPEALLEYEINKTWDNKATPGNAKITIMLKKSSKSTENILIQVEAPFYDDPKLPVNVPVGRVDGLWDYEVVEIFFLGKDQKYLEIELGPHGHYLVYYLEGVKNVTKNNLLLDNYKTEILEDGKRWKGEATIPLDYLPPNTTKFNAYGIHGSGDDRVYMSLFPTEEGKYAEPNFHRLEPFGHIGLFT